MRILLLSLLCFASFSMYAQRLENIRAQAINGGETVIITYDLTSSSKDQKYKVAVYSSHNNYTTPLSQVSGDIAEVTPGTGKQITWNARSEMVEYTGDVTFELRADLVSMPLSVKTPSTAKRGKLLTINYSGVGAGENVKLELVKGGVVVNQIGNTTDPTKYTWSVPMDVAKASDYQVRITVADRTATSGSFPVKNKTKPVVFIVAGAVVVTGVVVVLVSGGKNGGSSKDLPTPPDPTDGN